MRSNAPNAAKGMTVHEIVQQRSLTQTPEIRCQKIAALSAIYKGMGRVARPGVMALPGCSGLKRPVMRRSE